MKDFRTARVPMRYGHRKRLDVPKRGKAAIWAEIQGQGKEVLRGRSAFKRGQRGRRWHGSPEYRGKYGTMWLPSRRRRQLRSQTLEDAAEHMEAWEMESVPDEMEDIQEEERLEVEASEVGSDGSDMQSFHDESETETESSWSFYSCDAGSCSTASPRLWRAGSSGGKIPTKERTRWELALLIAELNAGIYAAYLQQHGLPSVLMQAKKRRTPRQRQSERRTIEAKLLQECQTSVVWDKQVPKEGRKKPAKQIPTIQRFDHFRKSFLEEHGLNFCTHLRSSFGGPLFLKPTPLSEGVQQKFLTATEELEGKVIPTYHGTSERNFPSIFQRGLLVPYEENNGIKVANGSAHGVGIYTAKMESPQLSLTFIRGPVSRSRQLLVCGVLDDAQVVQSQGDLKTFGALTVKAESQAVRHVGDAVVIFDSRRVAPLFVASAWAMPAPKPQVRQPPRRHVGPRTRLRKSRDKNGPFSHRQVQLFAFLARRGACKRRT